MGKCINLDSQLGTHLCEKEFSHAYIDKHNHKTAHFPWNNPVK